MFKFTILLLSALLLSSCVLTKVVTVPMRVGGAVISIVPVVGEGIEKKEENFADEVMAQVNN